MSSKAVIPVGTHEPDISQIDYIPASPCSPLARCYAGCHALTRSGCACLRDSRESSLRHWWQRVV